MKKSLAGVLMGIALLVGAMFLVLRKGPFGAGIILVGIAGLYFLTTLASEIVKLYGKKVQGRDRHP